MTLGVHRGNVCVVEPSFPASIDALLLGSCDPLALTLFDEATLHLGHHTKDRKHDMAEFPTR